MNQTESQQQGTDLRLMLAQADALCLERRFEEAATIYQQLVTMAEFRLGPNHPDAILVLQRLADSLYAMNLFRDCLPLYERLCNVARGMLGDADPDVINLMLKVAKTQELVGSSVEARSTYEFAINSAVANLPPGHELTTQLRERYKLLVEQIEENKQAAQAWKENTVTNPIISIGPDGRPIPVTSMAQPPMPPMPQMPPLQQIAPGTVPQSMIGQLPPHLASPGSLTSPPGHEPLPGTVPTPPAGAPYHPEGSPFANNSASPYNAGGPIHPPGSPFGDQSAPPYGAAPPLAQGQFQSPPPAMASLSAPPPVMSSPPGLQSNPWDPDPSQQQPPFPQQQMPPQLQMAPQQLSPGMPPLPQQISPSGVPPQMAAPQMAPPQQMMPPPQMQQLPPLPQSQQFPPAPQGMPPLPQSMPLTDFHDPRNLPGGAPTAGMQDPWNAGTPQPQMPQQPWDAQNETSSSSIGSKLMQELELDSSINSSPPSLSLPSVNNQAPNMMPTDGNGNQYGSSNLPPSGFPPLPQSSLGNPNAGVMQDPFRSDQGPPSVPNQYSAPPPNPGGGLYTAGPEPVRSTGPASLPSPLHQAGLVQGGPLPINDPFAETGRKNNPDPYLDHLAAKVADLKAQKAQSVEFEQPPMSPGSKVQSSGWHDAISMPVSERNQSQEIHRKKGPPPVLFEEGTEYGDFADNQGEVEERDRVAPNKKIKSSRVAASKSEDLVSNVRAFKEYLIPMVVILVIGVGGYYFLSNTVARPTLKVDETAVPATVGKTQEKKTFYATPDNTMRLAVGSRDCSLVDGKTLINVPCVVYDGSWSHAAMQIIDSVMEKQIWFNQMPEGMVTEDGTILFDTKAPDRLVIEQMNQMALAANGAYKSGAGYPTKPASINSQTYVYRNPFTGQTGLVKLQVMHEINNNREEIMNQMLAGGLVLGEPKFGRGDVRCYALSDASGGTEKGLGFFVRGADRNGNLFKVSNTGQTVLLGFLEGKDISNSHIQAADSTLPVTTPLKPTKVWIAKGQQLPIFVIYHSLPISMAIIAFLTFWRSLMVAPGQDPNNTLNRTFRFVSYGAIGIGVIASIIQYTFWM